MLAPDTYPTKKKRKKKRSFIYQSAVTQWTQFQQILGELLQPISKFLSNLKEGQFTNACWNPLYYVYCVTKFGLYIEINRRNMMVLQKRWGRQKLTSLLILQFLPNLNYKCISSGNNFRSHIFHSTFMQMPFPEHILKICHGLGAWNEWTTKTRWKGALRKKSQDPKRISYEHWKRKSSRERL